MTQILRIDASGRTEGSITRDLTDRIIGRLNGSVVRRDLSDALPHVDESWIGANFTPADERTPQQQEILALSDRLIAEIEAADTLVIGLPIYNFGVPAALKAWIDLVARAGVTFRYSEDGPEGLLKGKRAIVAVASGGTTMGSPQDHATGYLRYILGFIGIEDVSFVAADRMAVEPDKTLSAAREAVDALPVAA